MREELIDLVTSELRAKLVGRFVGKIFQLAPFALAIDFGLKSGEYLFISVDPSSPRLYLIKRRVKELEKVSVPLSPFAQLIRSRLASARITDVSKASDDRIVHATFESVSDAGTPERFRLTIQLTGRAANLLLLDEGGRIIETLRAPRGEGQQPGHHYQAPAKQPDQHQLEPVISITGDSPSHFADLYFTQLDASKLFDSRAGQVRARLHRELKQREKLRKNLLKDLEGHGDPEEHKRIGDLLLANIGTAERKGGTVEIVDYYSNDPARITLDIDESVTIPEAAARRFRRYSKAKRAREEILERLRSLEPEIAALEREKQDLDEIVAARDESALSKLHQDETKPFLAVLKKAEPARIPGVRHYVSSDGYEILVGRAARDNDQLTFRVARPNDLWLHAADYPGSHVIVRNPTRKELPQRTMIEAAQLAARFSQAGDDAKVVVHYTQRKFLAKPKGAAPGLVRMSQFRSITVEPKEAVSRLR